MITLPKYLIHVKFKMSAISVFGKTGATKDTFLNFLKSRYSLVGGPTKMKLDTL